MPDTTTIMPGTQATLDRLNTPSRITGGGLSSLDGGDFLRLHRKRGHARGYCGQA